ncbi:MAG: hypothetical protein JWM86_1651 [Thermoleophilia bacterium]|nr:hypothetical protein [Thermoleophilia bacterium]
MHVTCHTPTRRQRESAFSIVEVIIAVVVLAVVIVGASAMFASSTKSTTVARVRDKQSSVANDVLSRLQSDSSWASWCRQRQPTFNPNSPSCPIEQWVAQQPTLRNIGTVTDAGGNRFAFQVRVTAVGIDLAADGRGPNDEGSLPDLYRLTAMVAPDSSLAARFPSLNARSIQQEVNPTNRVVTGRVTVSGCIVTNQVDERIAAGDCNGSGYAAPLQPPANFDANRPASSCSTPSFSDGGANRDCLAFKCANPQWANAVRGQCQAQGAWRSTSPRDEFSSIRVVPAQGTVRLRRGGRTYGPYRLAAGTVTVKNLPVGRYAIDMDVTNGSSRLWRSKSVPSSGQIAVEAGLNSRAVLMFRPAARGTVRIDIDGIDSSIPWAPRTFDGYTEIDKWGNTINGGTDTVRLVPVPKGRLLWRDTASVTVQQTLSTRAFVFTDVEPGLYSYELADPTYTYFKQVTNTAGFIYVYPDGRVYYGVGAVPKWINGMCAQYVRLPYVGETRPDLGFTSPIGPCRSSTGNTPTGGGNGGGKT